MATNLFAPAGLIWSRNLIGAAPNAQTRQFKIKQGYGTNIAKGDLVMTGTSGNQGYVVLWTTGNAVLGVFDGVQPYYDATAQQTMHGNNGSYASTANPNGDILCNVITDPFAIFRIQVSAASNAYAESWRGQNINILSGSNGAPNSAGTSILAADYSTLATTSTLPMRIEGAVGVTGGPQDPANYNPWIEVRINNSEVLTSTGI